jgi:hypothetical protein
MRSYRVRRVKGKARKSAKVRLSAKVPRSAKLSRKKRGRSNKSRKSFKGRKNITQKNRRRTRRMKGGVSLAYQREQQEEDKEWAQIVDRDMTFLSEIFGIKYIRVNNEYEDDTALNRKLLETLSEPLDETQLSELSRSEKVVLIMDMEKYEDNMSRDFWSDDIPPWDDNQQRYINAIWRKFRKIKRNDIQASRGQAVGVVGSGPKGVGGGTRELGAEPPETAIWETIPAGATAPRTIQPTLYGMRQRTRGYVYPFEYEARLKQIKDYPVFELNFPSSSLIFSLASSSSFLVFRYNSLKLLYLSHLSFLFFLPPN